MLAQLLAGNVGVTSRWRVQPAATHPDRRAHLIAHCLNELGVMLGQLRWQLTIRWHWVNVCGCMQHQRMRHNNNVGGLQHGTTCVRRLTAGAVSDAHDPVQHAPPQVTVAWARLQMGGGMHEPQAGCPYACDATTPCRQRFLLIVPGRAAVGRTPQTLGVAGQTSQAEATACTRRTCSSLHVSENQSHAPPPAASLAAGMATLFNNPCGCRVCRPVQCP